MIYKTHVFEVKTSYEDEMVNVTKIVTDLIEDSKVKTGEVILFVPHTTAAVTINENTDPDVQRDILLGLRKVFVKDRDYKHYEGNSHAHLKSSIVGVDQSVLISEGELVLGNWQGIYFMEFDGPRSRKLVVRIHGE